MNRILVVDDDSDIALTFRAGLREYGFEVDSFVEPVKALEEYEPAKYDLLLLDIRMPKMDGFELYRRIRKIDDKVRVCFITAYDVSSEDFGNLSGNGSVFIKKPIDIEQLSNIVNEILP